MDKKVLALVDTSTYAQSVCDHAAWVAKGANAGVTLLHVLGRRDGIGGDSMNLSGSIGLGARSALLAELADLDAQRAKLAQQKGRAVLEDAERHLNDAGVGEVSTKLRIGDLVDTVTDLEGDQDLILVGKRGEAADFAKGHLGSNLERVVRATSKPVLVASRAFKPVRRFLIADDGGRSVDKAVDHLCQSTLFKGLECLVLTVGPDTAEARDRLARTEQKLTAAGYSVTTDIRAGLPETVIGDAVEGDQIDLVVMGAYGHSRIRTLIIGSTTAEMLRSCRVPVMLFR